MILEILYFGPVNITFCHFIIFLLSHVFLLALIVNLNFLQLYKLDIHEAKKPYNIQNFIYTNLQELKKTTMS